MVSEATESRAHRFSDPIAGEPGFQVGNSALRCANAIPDSPGMLISATNRSTLRCFAKHPSASVPDRVVSVSQPSSSSIEATKFLWHSKRLVPASEARHPSPSSATSIHAELSGVAAWYSARGRKLQSSVIFLFNDRLLFLGMRHRQRGNLVPLLDNGCI